MKITQANEIKAKATAYRITQEYSFSKPDEIILEDIAMARGVLVVEGALDGAEARLIRKGNKGIIRIREDIPEVGRKRFAIAHELGHWELHPDISQLDLYSEAAIKGYGSDPVELEASIFASELLMPTKLYRPRCKDVMPNIRLVKVLADEFQTSLTSAVVKYVQETEQSCAVVFSENGKVTWWQRSDNCNELWFEKRQQIHKESLAWQCLNGGVVPEDGEVVPFEMWIESENRYRVEKIREQSLKLGRYPVVLSLLWVNYR